MSTPTTSAPQSFVISLGVDRIDPGYYGWSGNLRSCVHDADFYLRLVPSGPGVSHVRFVNKRATYSAVVGAIRAAAQRAQAGDFVLIAFSGHGIQVIDRKGGADDLDDAMCLFDQTLLDDDLYALWSTFAAGVNIVVLADCCHSGTIIRMLETVYTSWARHGIRERLRFEAAAERALLAATPPVAPDSGARFVRRRRRTLLRSLERAASRYGTSSSDNHSGQPAPEVTIKEMPPARNLVYLEQHAAELAARQARLPIDPPIGAAVLLLAACRDDQTALANHGKNSLFTGTLKRVLNHGFRGTYAQLVDAVTNALPADIRSLHTPTIYLLGTNPEALANAPAFRSFTDPEPAPRRK